MLGSKLTFLEDIKLHLQQSRIFEPITYHRHAVKDSIGRLHQQPHDIIAIGHNQVRTLTQRVKLMHQRSDAPGLLGFIRETHRAEIRMQLHVDTMIDKRFGYLIRPRFISGIGIIGTPHQHYLLRLGLVDEFLLLATVKQRFRLHGRYLVITRLFKRWLPDPVRTRNSRRSSFCCCGSLRNSSRSSGCL